MTDEPDRHRPARLSPGGYVAQRMDTDFGDYGPWLLTYYDDASDQLVMQALTDADVAHWLPLSLVTGRENELP